MSSPRVARRVWATALAGAAFAAGMGGCEPGTHGPAHAGLVDVMLATPHPSDQAFLIAFSGPVGAFRPAPGYDAFRPSPSGPNVLVVAAGPMAAGETRIGTLEVGRASTTDPAAAALIDVARSDYALRASLDGYAVRLLPRPAAP